MDVFLYWLSPLFCDHLLTLTPVQTRATFLSSPSFSVLFGQTALSRSLQKKKKKKKGLTLPGVAPLALHGHAYIPVRFKIKPNGKLHVKKEKKKKLRNAVVGFFFHERPAEKTSSSLHCEAVKMGLSERSMCSTVSRNNQLYARKWLSAKRSDYCARPKKIFYPRVQTLKG